MKNDYQSSSKYEKLLKNILNEGVNKIEIWDKRGIDFFTIHEYENDENDPYVKAFKKFLNELKSINNDQINKLKND